MTTVIEIPDDITENGPKWPASTSWPVTLEKVAGNELLVCMDDGTVAAINYIIADELTHGSPNSSGSFKMGGRR